MKRGGLVLIANSVKVGIHCYASYVFFPPDLPMICILYVCLVTDSNADRILKATLPATIFNRKKER